MSSDNKPERKMKWKSIVTDYRFLFFGAVCLSVAGVLLFENYYVNFDPNKKKLDQKTSHRPDPAFVCLNETDPLYYISTYNKLACESLITLAYKIFLEREPTDNEIEKWMIKCTSAKFDPASLSWEFTQMDEHILLLQRKRKLYGYNRSTAASSFNPRGTTTTPSTVEDTTAPATICLTTVPDRVHVTIPYTTTPPPTQAITTTQATTTNPKIISTIEVTTTSPFTTTQVGSPEMLAVIDEPVITTMTMATTSIYTTVGSETTTFAPTTTVVATTQPETTTTTMFYPTTTAVPVTITTTEEPFETTIVQTVSSTMDDDYTTTFAPTAAVETTPMLTTTEMETTTEYITTTMAPPTTVQLTTEEYVATTTELAATTKSSVANTTASSSLYTTTASPNFTTAPVDEEDNNAVPLQMKLKKQEFKEELDNPESEEYKELSDGFKETMSEMLGDVPGFKEVRVLGFKNGSLVVIYEVVFEKQDPVVNVTDINDEAPTESSTEAASNRNSSTTPSNFSEEAKKKVKDAIATMLSDPEKRTKVLNNSLLVEEDFDFETVKFPSKEVVDTLKINNPKSKQVTTISSETTEFDVTTTSTPVTTTTSFPFTTFSSTLPPFVTTKIAESPLDHFQVVFMKLRVTNMNFTKNLTDRNNEEFRSLEKKFIELLNPLLLSLDNYAGMEVMGFSTGSLIANNELYFRQEVPVNISLKVKDRINAAANYFHYLDVRVDQDATQILKPGEADLCEFVTCNMYSECVERSKYRAECVCRPGYVQINPNVCVSSCELDPHYCKNGGECEVTEANGAKCRCKVSYNWAYTGERCEKLVSHAVVIMSATSALVLLASILAVIAICYYAVTGSDEDGKRSGNSSTGRQRPDISPPQTGSFPSSMTDTTNDYSYINQQFTQSTGTFTSASSFYDASTEQCRPHLSQQEVVLYAHTSNNKTNNTSGSSKNNQDRPRRSKEGRRGDKSSSSSSPKTSSTINIPSPPSVKPARSSRKTSASKTSSSSSSDMHMEF